VNFFAGPGPGREQPPGVEVEAVRAQLERLPTHQLGQAGRQIRGRGHPRHVNQDRDTACQGCIDLQPDKVTRVLQAPPPVLANDHQPLATDQRQQHIAVRDCGGNHLDKVIAQFDRVDVLRTRRKSSGRAERQLTAWLALATIACNLLRAAGSLAGRAYAKARGATIRHDLIDVAARTARHGRGHLTLHLPGSWHHHQAAWMDLFHAATGSPAHPA
jgi:hypothetical protein